MKQKILNGYKYKLKPTDEQCGLLHQHGGNTRFLQNLFLKTNTDHYADTTEFIFAKALINSIPELKKEYPFLGNSFSQSLQQVGRQFDRALNDCFKLGRGFPVYKKKATERDSFTIPQKQRFNDDIVFLPKIGEVKQVYTRPVQGKPKHLTVTQDGNDQFCSVTCEIEIDIPDFTDTNIVGIDLGIKTYATLSDGTVIENQKTLYKQEKKLKREQRRLSKKQKGSNNRSKQKSKLRNVHKKIRNIRKDFIHQTTHRMITKYDGFVMETLNIKGTMKNHKLAKSIADVGQSEFKRTLKYKSQQNGKYFIEIDRQEPTSKMCSDCSSIQDMPLSVRTYVCPVCGLVIDRDLNAAINIRNKCLEQISNSNVSTSTYRQQETKACGENVRPKKQVRAVSMKQERISRN